MKKNVSAVVGTALGVIGGVIGGTTYSKYLNGMKIDKEKEKTKRYEMYYYMLSKWITLKQQGKTLEEYFIMNNYKKIAIYGMGEMGKLLYNELASTSIEIEYVIDKNVDSIYIDMEIDAVDPEEEFLPVDAIVVTATYAYEEIKERIENKVVCPIVSLDDVVWMVADKEK